MHKLTQFVIANWPLVLAFVMILLWIVCEETRKKVRGVTKLSPAEVTQKINRDNAVVIDVRDSKAFNEGHIIGSINVPVADVEAKMKKLVKYKNRPVITVGASGMQSATVGAKLHAKGFTDVYHLNGGMPAWRRESLPITKA